MDQNYVDDLERERDGWKTSEGVVRGWLQTTIQERDEARAENVRLKGVIERLRAQIREQAGAVRGYLTTFDE